jgi:hypothetical protein
LTLKSDGAVTVFMIWLVGKEKKFTPPKIPKIPKKHGEEGLDEKAEIGWDGGARDNAETLKN